MFNRITADSLKSLPPVSGVDTQRMPQILSKVYAHIVGLKSKYQVGVHNFEPEEIAEDYRMLKDLSFTLEIYLESGKFEKQTEAIAFVDAMSHKLMGKLKEQKLESLSYDNVPPDLIAVLLFVIGGYIADAKELACNVKKGLEESDEAWNLKQNIVCLVSGKLSEIVNSQDANVSGMSYDDYAHNLLWNNLSKGIKEAAKMLLGKECSEYEPFFQKVMDLSVYYDKDSGEKYDFPGISRLARLLSMATIALKYHSTINVVSGYISSQYHLNLIKHITSSRPYLWRNHIDAIERGFLREGTSSVITFPTGAGKSTLVELKIIQHIAVGGKVVYIVPTHALENQVRNRMSRLLGIREYRSINIGKEFTYEEEDNQPVLVMTPERCSTLLALNPSLFSDVSLVIMDEFHIIGEDGHRSLGAMYCLVSLLSLRDKADFVLVSAMVENGAEVAEWISATTGRECLNLSMAWKPTSQLQGCVVYPLNKVVELQKLADEDKSNKGIRKSPSSALKRKLLAVPHCFFSLCNTWESNDIDDYYLTTILDHPVELGINKYWTLTGNRNYVSLELAKKFAAIGLKTTVFVENPSQANSLIKQLNIGTNNISLSATVKKKIDAIAMEFGESSCSYIENGMQAVPHHSQLLLEERMVMEELFKKDIDIMVATPTLAQGVNLPVDVVLIAGETRYDEETNGQSKVDAHEILNAVGRAGRAGYRSQGAAILVSNRVIGIENDKISKDWFEIKDDIFSKGDNCLTVIDPLEKLMDIDGAEVSQEQRNVLMKLNLLGVNERKVLTKSFYAYQLLNNNKDITDFIDRVVLMSSYYEGENRTPLMEISLKTGIDINVLSSFYSWLHDTIKDKDDFSPLDLLKLYCDWMKGTPDVINYLISYKSTIELLIKTFGETCVLNASFIMSLWRVLDMYMKGFSLKDISAELNEKINDVHITATRKFILKVIPELSYAFSVMTMVHIRYLLDKGLNETEIPASIKNFSTYLKEGVSSEEMLRFKIQRRLMRVETHRLFSNN